MGAEIVTAEGTSTASYVYDGDGNQVIAVVDDDLRVYIGQHFEVRVLNGAEITDPPRLDGPRQAAALPADPCPEGTYCIFLGGIFNLNEDPTPPQEPRLSWRSYYFAGGKRIAMREVNALGDPFGTVTWLLGDHLGSTSLSVSESGGVLAEAKYTPWGDQRTLAGDLPTDYGYTGQREESALGLMYYVARWYDSGIGHFVQADTVVPGAGNPAAWNRYAYVMYNPVKFVDPSGHFTKEQLDEWFSTEDKTWREVLEETYSQEFITILLDPDVNLGDLLKFEFSGQNFSGVFVLDEEGNLALWDMNKKEEMDLSSDINPLTVYENEGDGVFSLLINKTGQAQAQEIQFGSDWMYSKDIFVERRDVIVDYGLGLLTVASIGIGVYELTVGIGAYAAGATLFPWLGLAALTIDLASNLEMGVEYQVQSYLDAPAMMSMNGNR